MIESHDQQLKYGNKEGLEYNLALKFAFNVYKHRNMPLIIRCLKFKDFHFPYLPFVTRSSQLYYNFEFWMATSEECKDSIIFGHCF